MKRTSYKIIRDERFYRRFVATRQSLWEENQPIIAVRFLSR